MIDTALTLIDYLIKLLQKREESIDEYFELYIRPAYDAAEVVFADYLNLLHSVKRKIEQNDRPEEIIKYLEDGRIKHLPVRMRLRAEIGNRLPLAQEYLRHDEADPRRLPPFERGILGILMGGVGPFEDAVRQPNPYLYGHHTLLDILYRLSDYSIHSTTARYRSLRSIDNQIEALKSAWQDVVVGYAEYKALVAPKPFKMKSYKYKREGD